MARRNQPAEADPLLGPGEKQFAVVKQQPQPWTHLLRTKRRRKCACGAVAVVLPCVVVGVYYAVADVEESLDDGAERFLASPYNVTCSEYDDDVVYSATTCKSQDWGFCYKGDKTFSVDGAASEDDDATTASYTTCVNGTACYDWCNVACEQGWGAYCVWDIYANLEAACAGNYTPVPPGRRRSSKPFVTPSRPWRFAKPPAGSRLVPVTNWRSFARFSSGRPATKLQKFATAGSSSS